jgi:uncharacterized protein YbjQ (UPF0145 family)
MEELFGLVVAVVVIAVGFLAGRATERNHLADLARRETELASVRVDSLKAPVGAAAGAPGPALVCGEAVIASDAFKSWAFGLRNIFGGEARNFTTLFSRARREATLRMMEDARRQGFDAVCNVRHASADIGGNAEASAKRSKPMATCIAFGTGYKRA